MGDASENDVESPTSSPESRAASQAGSSRPRPADARRSTSSSAGVIRSGQQQQGLDRCGQSPAPVEEDLLDMLGEVELRR